MFIRKKTFKNFVATLREMLEHNETKTDLAVIEINFIRDRLSAVMDYLKIETDCDPEEPNKIIIKKQKKWTKKNVKYVAV